MRVYVFSSNELGKNDEGTAKFAMQNFDAIEGIGFGPSGKAFAIPTKDWKMRPLPLEIIKQYIDRFIAYAEYKEDTRFDLTKVGCGLTGYTEDQIAPLFKKAPENVHLVGKQFQSICLAKDWWENVSRII